MQSHPTLSDVFPLPNETKRLRVFLGNWGVEGAVNFMERSFTLKGSATFSEAAAGWGILVIAKLTIETLGNYEEADLLTFSKNENVYHFFAVTNTAAAYDHKGNWQDDETLNFVYEGLQNGKSYKEELSIKISNSLQFTIKERDFVDNQVVTTLSVFLTKKSD